MFPWRVFSSMCWSPPGRLSHPVSGPEHRAGAVTDTSDAKARFRDGFFLQFVNPKIYIYCIVSMQSCVLPLYQGQSMTLLL